MKVALLGCPDYRFAAATNLALDTGMRRGELCALRWRDVNFDEGIIRVRRALAEARTTDTYCGDTLEGEAAQEQSLELGTSPFPKGRSNSCAITSRSSIVLCTTT